MNLKHNIFIMLLISSCGGGKSSPVIKKRKMVSSDIENILKKCDAKDIKQFFSDTEGKIDNYPKLICEILLTKSELIDSIPIEYFEKIDSDGSNILHLLVDAKLRNKEYRNLLQLTFAKCTQGQESQKNNKGFSPMLLAMYNNNVFFGILISKHFESNDEITKLNNLRKEHFEKSKVSEYFNYMLEFIEKEMFDEAILFSELRLNDKRTVFEYGNSGGTKNETDHGHEFAILNLYSVNSLDDKTNETVLTRLYREGEVSRVKELLDRKITIKDENNNDKEVNLCLVQKFHVMSSDDRNPLPLIVLALKNRDWTTLEKCLDILSLYEDKTNIRKDQGMPVNPLKDSITDISQLETDVYTTPSNKEESISFVSQMILNIKLAEQNEDYISKLIKIFTKIVNIGFYMDSKQSHFVVKHGKKGKAEFNKSPNDYIKSIKNKELKKQLTEIVNSKK